MKKNQIELQELKNATTAFKISMDEFNNTLEITEARINEEEIIHNVVRKNEKRVRERGQSKKVYVKSVKSKEDKQWGRGNI